MKKNLLIVLFLLSILEIAKAQEPRLWGMTTNGGIYGGEGTIFKINSDGSGFNTVFNFLSPHGFHPYGNLLLASNGYLYGTCYDGGAFASCTIFRYDTLTGNYLDVYDFDIDHGDFPMSGLVEAQNGILYGAASARQYLPDGGVIYSLDPATNLYTDLYECSQNSGHTPFSCPIILNDKLYGTMSAGGNNYGAIYRYDILINTYSDIHDFDNANGATPYGGLLKHSNGKLYGNTFSGGAKDSGVIYSLDPPNNTFQKLFDLGGANGANPYGALTEGLNGKIFGVTETGGKNQAGVLFSLNPADNSFTKIFDFDTATGSRPMGNLTYNNKGKLFGTTSEGGSSNKGVLFSYDLYSSMYKVIFEFNDTNGASPNCGFIPGSSFSTTGIAQSDVSGRQATVYPNPAHDRITIEMPMEAIEGTEVILMNSMGEKVFSFTEKGAGAHSARSIDVSGFPRGLYFLEMNTGGRKKVRKLAME